MNDDLLEHPAANSADAATPPIHPDLLAAQQDAPAPTPGSLRPPADIWRDVQELRRLEDEKRAQADARQKAHAANYAGLLTGASDKGAVDEITQLLVQADLYKAGAVAAMADLQAAEARVLQGEKDALKGEASKLMAERVKAGGDVVAAIDVLIQRMSVLRRIDVSAVQLMSRAKKLHPAGQRKSVLVLESFTCMANPQQVFDWLALHMRHRTGDTWFAHDMGGQTRAFDEFVSGTSAQAVNELAYLLD
jgi:hypothetical protein